MRVAVVDMGTNSTRLLVADVDGGRVREVERRSTVTRLGRGVDLSGQLAAEAIEDVCAAVAGYIGLYEDLGAERVVAIATSAVRDASNSQMFLAELRERFALDARILEGSVEGRLTYLGACAERPPADKMLVVDSGGHGAAEVISFSRQSTRWGLSYREVARSTAITVPSRCHHVRGLRRSTSARAAKVKTCS